MITTDNIQDFKVLSSSSRQLLQSSSIGLSYTIQSATESYSSLSNTLNAAVTFSNTFNQNMQTIATYAGVTPLVTATSAPVVIINSSPTKLPTKAPVVQQQPPADASKPPPLPVGAVVGSLFAIATVAIGAYVFYRYYYKKKGSDAVKTITVNTDSTVAQTISPLGHRVFKESVETERRNPDHVFIESVETGRHHPDHVLNDSVEITEHHHSDHVFKESVETTEGHHPDHVFQESVETTERHHPGRGSYSFETSL